MNFSLLEQVLLFFTILLLFLLFAQGVYWRFKKSTYTRERFAFFGTTAIITTITILLPIAFGNNTWLIILNFVTENFFDYKLDTQEPDYSDRILVVLIIGLVISHIQKTFKNWTGKKSLRQVELEKRKEKTTLLRELQAFLQKDKKLKVFNPVLDEIVDFNLSEARYEKLPWEEQIAELLSIYSTQYNIDLSQDWFRKEKTFISKYGKNESLGVLCIDKIPSDARIKDFISFVFRQSNNLSSNHKFIIASKFEKFAPFTKQINGHLIEFENEISLLNNLADFSSYFRYVIHKFEKKEIITGIPYTIQETYTNPYCVIEKDKTLGNKHIEIKNIEKYISDWLSEEQSKKHIALLGEYGQGKSVLSLRLAYLIAKKEIITDRIPIIIELRGKYPKQYQNILSLFSDWASNFGINPKALLKLHYAGRLLIIFEGFDEMELIGDYEIRLDHFRRLWEFSTPNSKLIITGRPNFFLNRNELKTLLRTEDSMTNLPFCEELYLKKFDLPQIQNTLRNIDGETKKDILSILKMPQNVNSSFFDLMSRPSSLFLTSVVWKKRNLSKFKNNINSAIVIEEFLKDSYSRQENKKLKTPLSIHERAYFMQGIAVGMVQKNGYTNQISQNDLKDLIVKLYEEFPEELTKRQVISNSSSYKKPLQKRFDSRYNKESVLLDVRSCGVLVRDLATFDSFMFSHKSFLELLISNFFISHIIDYEGKDEENVEEIIRNSIASTFQINKNTIRKSPDVIKFISQLAAKKISIPENCSPKEQLRFLFKKLYPYKRVGLNMGLQLSSFKLIDLIRLSILLYPLFYLITNFIEDINKIVTDGLHLDANLVKFITLFSFIIMTTVLLFTMFKGSRRREKIKLAKEVLLTNKNYYNLPNNNLVDNNNLTLWFILAKEFNLSEYLPKIMSKKMYKDLEFREAVLNKNQKFLLDFLIKEKAIKVTEEKEGKKGKKYTIEL